MTIIEPFRLQDFNTLLLTHGATHRLGGMLNSDKVVPYAFGLLRKWTTIREHEGKSRLSPEVTTKLGAISIVLSAIIQRERVEAGAPYDTIHCPTVMLMSDKKLPKEGTLVRAILRLAFDRPEAAEFLYEAILERGYQDIELLKTIAEDRNALSAAQL